MDCLPNQLLRQPTMACSRWCMVDCCFKRFSHGKEGSTFGDIADVCRAAYEIFPNQEVIFDGSYLDQT